MGLQVARSGNGHILTGAADGAGELVNGFLAHLTTNFSPATRRAYAFDLLNFLRFLMERRLGLADVGPTDLFDYFDWQQQPQKNSGGTVVRLTSRAGAAEATMNRRIAAVRSLYDYAVIAGAANGNPVPAARRSSGFRAMRRGLLGHLGMAVSVARGN
jgi:integrase/recombinase XerC